MGWVEWQTWVGVMQRQQKPPETSPDSWAGSQNDPRWAEMRKRHAEATGRA